MTARKFARTLALSVSAFTMLGPVPARAQYQQPPCVTKSECDYREDQRETQALHDQWNANVKYQEEAAAERRRLNAQVEARTENGRLSRIQDVMRRRREAAARAGH